MGRPNPDVAHQPCEHSRVRKEWERVQDRHTADVSKYGLGQVFRLWLRTQPLLAETAAYVRYEQAHGEQTTDC